MLDLPDVTLFSFYTPDLEHLTLKALDDCFKNARFGDVQLFNRTADFDFGHFHYYEFPKYIKTSHVLGFQWDAWIINPLAWTDEFLEYDYIGAPWWYNDGFNVGNSGFCLRSKKLMDYLAGRPEEFPYKHPEDDTLCRHYQKRLPQFKWAPDLLAYRFAFERVRHPFFLPFGFHGIFNWPYVLTDEEIEKRLVNAPQYIFNKVEYPQMLELMFRRKAE